MLGKRKTGNERWVRNVITELRTSSDHDLVAFTTDAGVELPGGVERRVLRPAWPVARQLWSLRRAVRRARIDVLLVQYVAPQRLPCPVVTVVHDVSFIEHPQWFSPLERVWMRRLITRTMRRASAVITVSAFSKSEIVRLIGTNPSKIVVAHDGVDPVFLEASPGEQHPDPAAVLAVGNITTRKNLGTLISAYHRLLGARPTAPTLLVAGQDAHGAGPIHEAAAPLGAAVRFLGYVDDADLARLMRTAVVVTYPSRYEGFGLPVVEAMAAGTPVIASDIPVMREVAGDAALLVPPEDAAGWADAMERILEDAGLRQRLAAAGRERATRYTWERCAATVRDVLERAVASA